MERLAVYTSIDGKIMTDLIKPNGNTEVIHKIPHGRVKLFKNIIYNDENHTFSEVWVEDCRQHLLKNKLIRDIAFAIHSEDVIYESHIGV